MASAEVGDDVMGEDPSITELQNRTAELCGMDAALYFPSGTSANLCAIGAHCQRGTEVICGASSHIFIYEGGGASGLLSVAFNTVHNNADGTMDLQEVESRIRKYDPHYPITGLVAVENTHNIRGGTILPPDYLSSLKALCTKHGLSLHMDGARLWNASAELGISMRELLKDVDTVSVCYSKGLGAPVGSVLCGPPDFIEKARRLRKVTGGGMRQAGIIASAAVYALENKFPVMKEDHRRCRVVRDALATIPQVSVPDQVDTNILFFEVNDGPVLCAALAEKGFKLGSYGDHRVRLTTHCNIDDDDITGVIAAIKEHYQHQ
jgi:threonine aldolase